MSASEKLQALLHDARTSDHGMDNDIHGEPLLLSLPQIVAVVSWAERFSNNSDYHGWTNKERPRLEPELDAFLAALDASLEEAML